MILNKRYFLVQCCLIFFLQFTFTHAADNGAKQEVGQLAIVSGQVVIASDSDPAKDKGRPAKPGDALRNNDVVRTGADSSAKILFSDQSVVDLGANAAFKISDYALNDGENRSGVFSLFYGKIRALVTRKVGPQGKVEFRSGQTVMGVRGTEFVVDTPKPIAGVPPLPTTVVVVAGVVAVTPPGSTVPTSIGAGQMCSTPQTNTTTANTSGGSNAANNSGSSANSESGSDTSAKSENGKPAGKPANTTAGNGNSASGGLVVSKVSTEQMQSAIGSVKTADNTFIGAVQIAPNNSNNSSGGPGGGMALAAVGNLVSNAVVLPPPSADSKGDKPAPLPGFLSSALNQVTPPVSIIPGNLVRVSVSVQ